MIGAATVALADLRDSYDSDNGVYTSSGWSYAKAENYDCFRFVRKLLASRCVAQVMLINRNVGNTNHQQRAQIIKDTQERSNLCRVMLFKHCTLYARWRIIDAAGDFFETMLLVNARRRAQHVSRWEHITSSCFHSVMINMRLGQISAWTSIHLGRWLRKGRRMVPWIFT